MASRFYVSTMGLAVSIAAAICAPAAGCAAGEELDTSLLDGSAPKHGATGSGGSTGATSLPAGGASGTSDPTTGSGGSGDQGGSTGSGGNGNVADSSTPASGGSAGQRGSAGSAGTDMPMDAAIIVPDAPLAKGIVVLYHAGDNKASNDTIWFFMKIANNGTTPVPIGALKIRYYFTDELNQSGKASIYESFTTPFPVEGTHAPDYIKMTTETVKRVTLPNSYLELTVTTADQLAPGVALTMQVAYSATAGQPLDETNDYSANLAQTTMYVPTTKIDVFQGDTLIAGDAPPY